MCDKVKYNTRKEANQALLLIQPIRKKEKETKRCSYQILLVLKYADARIYLNRFV